MHIIHSKDPLIPSVSAMENLQRNIDYWGDRCCKAEAETERMKALLARCLKSVEGGKWRDKANLSAEAHPVWDDVRETLRPYQQERKPDAAG